MNKYLKIVLFSLVGGALGYGYYYYVGCSNGGHCPLTSRWYITTLYGLVVGLLMATPLNSKGKNDTASVDDKQKNL